MVGSSDKVVCWVSASLNLTEPATFHWIFLMILLRKYCHPAMVEYLLSNTVIDCRPHDKLSIPVSHYPPRHSGVVPGPESRKYQWLYKSNFWCVAKSYERVYAPNRYLQIEQ